MGRGADPGAAPGIHRDFRVGVGRPEDESIGHHADIRAQANDFYFKGFPGICFPQNTGHIKGTEVFFSTFVYSFPSRAFWTSPSRAWPGVPSIQ